MHDESTFIEIECSVRREETLESVTVDVEVDGLEEAPAGMGWKLGRSTISC